MIDGVGQRPSRVDYHLLVLNEDAMTQLPGRRQLRVVPEIRVEEVIRDQLFAEDGLRKKKMKIWPVERLGVEEVCNYPEDLGHAGLLRLRTMILDR